MKVFTILLKSNPERVANVLKIKTKIPTEIVPAVEGNSNELEFCLDGRTIGDKYLKFCRRGEIACLLSHIRVWKKIVKTDLPGAIVLEDDANIPDDFLEKFNKLDIPSTADFVYLFVHPEQQKKTDRLSKGYFTYGTVSYWLSRSTAEGLINLFDRHIADAVDKSIAWWLDYYQKEYYCVGKNLVETTGNLYQTDTNSTIGASQYYRDSIPEFTYYLEEQDYFCYPCVNVKHGIIEKSEKGMIENKLRALQNKNVAGFTSNGEFFETFNPVKDLDTAVYIKSSRAERKRSAILLTGGCGYIGSHCLLELLLKYGSKYEIVIVDNLSNSNLENYQSIADLGVTFFYNKDITILEGLRNIFQTHRIVQVIHLAGYKSLSESVSEPLLYYYNNIFGLVNLLECIKNMDTHENKCSLIFSSSATVYGIPESLPLTEQSATHPTNPYGQTKLMSEQIIKDSGIPSVILRYFNPVGCHQSRLIRELSRGPPANLFPHILEVISGKKELVNVFGNNYATVDGTGVRDYIHVTDLAKAHLCAIDYLNANKTFSIFNLGTGKGYSVLEVIQEFQKQLGKSVPYKIADRRAGDCGQVWCDPTLAEQQMGWSAKSDLSEMVTTVLF